MEEEQQQLEFRDKRNGDWYWIHRVVFEQYSPKIGTTGLALYNAYASYARDSGKAWPSQKKVADILGISIMTLIKYNQILINNKLIKIESGKKKGTSNRITLLKVRGIKQLETPSKPIGDPGINLLETNDKHIERETKKEIAGTSPAPWDLNKYLEEMEENKQRHINIIAFYFKEKELTGIENKEQMQVLIKRHLRAARELVPFTDVQINRAAEQAKKEYPGLWTAETLVKILTR